MNISFTRGNKTHLTLPFEALPYNLESVTDAFYEAVLPYSCADFCVSKRNVSKSNVLAYINHRLPYLTKTSFNTHDVSYMTYLTFS